MAENVTNPASMTYYVLMITFRRAVGGVRARARAGFGSRAASWLALIGAVGIGSGHTREGRERPH
eukprot:scaffold97094_cov75-Phaeocystis_antarctica.AAC.2